MGWHITVSRIPNAYTIRSGFDGLDDGGLDLLNSSVCYVQKVEEEKEDKSRLCVWMGFKPYSLQSSLLSSMEAADEAIHVIERKGMSYGP